MTHRLLGILVALTLFPAAAVYAAIVPLFMLLFAFGATSLSTLAVMGVAGAVAFLCLVLAIMMLIKPRRALVVAGSILSMIALILFLSVKRYQGFYG